MNPLVTVVVSTSRQPAQLKACLNALSQQKISLSQFEVIVMDEADDAATAALVDLVSQQTGLNTRYLQHSRRQGVVSPYNRGWRLAKSLFVAFTHENCVPHPLWLTTALPLFSRGAQVIIGRVQYSIPNHPGAASTAISANLLCRRSVLSDLNGFNEQIHSKIKLGADWLDKLARLGIPVTPCPDAIVMVRVKPLAWYMKLWLTATEQLRTWLSTRSGA